MPVSEREFWEVKRKVDENDRRLKSLELAEARREGIAAEAAREGAKKSAFWVGAIGVAGIVGQLVVGFVFHGAHLALHWVAHP